MCSLTETNKKGEEKMPTYVLDSKCKGNGKCEEVCPSDIMRLDRESNKAYNVEPDMCWECFSCVKACPENAINMRPYADYGPLGSEISVKRDEERNTIKWDIVYRDQRKKHFEFAIRTTKWGSINIEDKVVRDLDDEELAGEPQMLFTGKPLPIIERK